MMWLCRLALYLICITYLLSLPFCLSPSFPCLACHWGWTLHLSHAPAYSYLTPPPTLISHPCLLLSHTPAYSYLTPLPTPIYSLFLLFQSRLPCQPGNNSVLSEIPHTTPVEVTLPCKLIVSSLSWSGQKAPNQWITSHWCPSPLSPGPPWTHAKLTSTCWRQPPSHRPVTLCCFYPSPAPVAGG